MIIHQDPGRTQPENNTCRTSRPNENSSRPWHTVSDREQRQGSAPSPQSVSSIDRYDQQTNQGNYFRDTRACYGCGQVGHIGKDCPQSVWCDFCRKNTHSTRNCHSKARATSTPRYPTEQTKNDEASTHNTTNTSVDQSNLADMMRSQMEHKQIATRLKYKKNRLRKIKEFDGIKKELCVTWIEHNRTAAKEVRIPLRESLLENSTGDVYEVIAMASGEMSKAELISYVLENFSDIPTREDAENKLRTIRRLSKPLLTYNAKYAAIHLIAFGTEPKDQLGESIWRNYANTLDKDLTHKLNKDIGNQKGRYIHHQRSQRTTASVPRAVDTTKVVLTSETTVTNRIDIQEVQM